METQDIFTIMGGRVKLTRGSYAPSADAIWLAAFADGKPKTVLDVGTGTGAVALCLMERMPRVEMTVLDISPKMLEECAKNFILNQRTANFVEADILKWHPPLVFDMVLTNPPYFSGTPAAHNAHHNVNLVQWMRRCIARVKPQGTIATIVDASVASTVIGEISRNCGDVCIFPLFSTKDTAERVLISGRVSSKGPSKIFTGALMNCDEILRTGMSINKYMALEAEKLKH